jgi:hypothetical protein
LRVNKGASRQIIKLEADIAESTREVAQANQKAAEANEKAEFEHLSRLQLEARLAPRTLTAEQQARLTSLLRPFSGIEVGVITYGDTSEIRRISIMIRDCLQNAGWKVHSVKMVASETVVEGILVGISANTDATIHNSARILSTALQSMGIAADPRDFNQMWYPGPEVVNMKIYIGSKP